MAEAYRSRVVSAETSFRVAGAPRVLGVRVAVARAMGAHVTGARVTCARAMGTTGCPEVSVPTLIGYISAQCCSIRISF